MKLTVKQFRQQNAYWGDDYYNYAIHKTDGGAMYLFQVDGNRLTQKGIDNAKILRLDGMNIQRLLENIKRVAEEK